jgi:hypothetical protein
MTYLSVATAFAAVLVSANLLLTFLLIRRVNRHGERLARRGSGPARFFALPSGGKVPALTLPTISGGTYSLGGQERGRSVVAFLSSECPACQRQIQELREYARTMPGGAARVLAVVQARDTESATDFVRELTGWASVALEPPQGTAQRAFSVSSYPSFYALADDGRIEAGAITVRHLAAAMQRA